MADLLIAKHGCSFDGKRDSKKNAALKTELARLCGEDMQDWMLTEMIQNRQKQAVKSKARSILYLAYAQI